MKTLKVLLDNNRAWSERIKSSDPEYFKKLSEQQAPKYLWIGCSDSRVPANEIVSLPPGQVFVHRNVANVVVHTDFNCLSVIEYAVEVLKVKHIIVCGHYGCGGVKAALGTSQLGLIDNWLRHIKDVAQNNESILAKCQDEVGKINRLCELNVIEQVYNVCYTTIVQKAWSRGQELSVHSWIYGLEDGLIKDLGLCVNGPEDIEKIYRTNS